MTTTAAPTVKGKELVGFGLVESANINSITNFTPSKTNEKEANTEKEKEDFVNIFICHLIFYAVFCVSLVLHILIDLGLVTFIKNKYTQFFGSIKVTIFEKSSAFA